MFKIEEPNETHVSNSYDFCDDITKYTKNIKNVLIKIIKDNNSNLEYESHLIHYIKDIIKNDDKMEFISFMFFKFSYNIFKINKRVSVLLATTMYLAHIYDMLYDCDLNEISSENRMLLSNTILTLIFEILSSNILKIEQNQKSKIISIFANSLGKNGIINGNFLQSISYNNNCCDKDIETRILKLKTGSLLKIMLEIFEALNVVDVHKKKAIDAFIVHFLSMLQIIKQCEHFNSYYTADFNIIFNNEQTFVIKQFNLLKEQSLDILFKAFDKRQILSIAEIIEFLDKKIQAQILITD